MVQAARGNVNEKRKYKERRTRGNNEGRKTKIFYVCVKKYGNSRRHSKGKLKSVKKEHSQGTDLGQTPKNNVKFMGNRGGYQDAEGGLLSLR